MPKYQFSVTNNQTARPHYVSDAWKLVRSDRSWWKEIMFASLAMFVPFIGFLWVDGKFNEYGRAVAWGSNEGFASFKISASDAIKSGFRVWVAVLAYGVLASILLSFLTTMFPFLAILTLPAEFVLATFLGVLSLHVTMRQDISSMFEFTDMVRMINDDYEEFFRYNLVLFGVTLLVSIVVSVVGLVAFFVFMFDVLARHAYAYTLVSEFAVMWKIFLFAVCIVYLALLVFTTLSLTWTVATALWMRQFIAHEDEGCACAETSEEGHACSCASQETAGESCCCAVPADAEQAHKEEVAAEHTATEAVSEAEETSVVVEAAKAETVEAPGEAEQSAIDEVQPKASEEDTKTAESTDAE